MLLLLLIGLAFVGAAAGYGLENLLRQCAVDAGYPMARYSRSRRRWVLAASGAIAFVLPAQLFSPAAAACISIFLVALIGAACIDFDHMIIPDLLTIGLAMLGLVLSLFVPGLHHCGSWNAWNCLRSAAAGMLGLAIGSALVLWFGLLGELLFRKEVMGFGDVKFVGAIGGFCGWQGAVFSVFGGAAIGVTIVMAMAIRRKLTRGHWGAASGRGLSAVGLAKAEGFAPPSCRGGAEFPFGPMLAAAAALYVLALHGPVDAYLAQYRALF